MRYEEKRAFDGRKIYAFEQFVCVFVRERGWGLWTVVRANAALWQPRATGDSMLVVTDLRVDHKQFDASRRKLININLKLWIVVVIDEGAWSVAIRPLCNVMVDQHGLMDWLRRARSWICWRFVLFLSLAKDERAFVRRWILDWMFRR